MVLNFVIDLVMRWIVKLLEYKSGVNNSADGSKPEFLHDFVKSVCCKAVE